MNTRPQTAPTQQDTWRERERIHWARRRQGDDARDGCGDEGRLILVVAQMEAVFMAARARLDAVKAAQSP